MKQEFVRLREVTAKRMDVADVPEWTVKTTLQRTVQALKRHRDLHFVESPEDRPASIIITTLAARAYTGGGPLYEVLVGVTTKMPGLVEQRSGVYWVANPVQPEENFADRWRDHPERARHFFEWMERVQLDFADLGQELGVDRVLDKIARTWGEGPAKRAGEVAGSALSRARDAGLLGMEASTGMLGPVMQRPVPRHTFHADAQTAREP
jgi:hypothetical protein